MIKMFNQDDNKKIAVDLRDIGYICTGNTSTTTRVSLKTKSSSFEINHPIEEVFEVWKVGKELPFVQLKNHMIIEEVFEVLKAVKELPFVQLKNHMININDIKGIEKAVGMYGKNRIILRTQGLILNDLPDSDIEKLEKILFIQGGENDTD